MLSKKHRIGVVCTVVALLVAIAGLSLYISGKPAALRALFGEETTAPTTPPVTVGSSASVTAAVQPETTAPPVLREKLPVPKQITGLWLAASGTDTANNELSRIKSKADAEKLLDSLLAMKFNALYLSMGSTFAKTAADPERAALRSSMQLLLHTAREKKLLTVLRVNCWEGKALRKGAAKELADTLAVFDADYLLLGGLGEQVKTLEADLRTLRTAAKAADQNLPVGLATTDERQKGMQQALQAGEIQSIYYEAPTIKPARSASMSETGADYSELISSSAGSFWCGFRADLLWSSGAPDPAGEVMEQMLEASSLTGCTARVLHASSLLGNKPSAADTMLIEYLRSDNPLIARRFEVKNQRSTNITTNAPSITFNGTSSPLYPLSCNGNEVERVESGDFSAELELNPGDNKVVFTHKGIEYSYHVSYKIQLLNKITPAKTVSAEGGEEMEISAVAHKSASVYATINGKRISLKESKRTQEGDETNSAGMPLGFALFTGSYTLPAAKEGRQQLGHIQVYASLNGLSQSAAGATVSVNAKPTTTVPPTTTAPPTTTTAPPTQKPDPNKPTDTSTAAPVPAAPKQFTPYQYNGVAGKSKYCEINVGFADVTPADGAKDLYHPHYSPLLKGMFDRIVGEGVYEDYSYYVLQCGKRVSKDEVKLIASGYNLPNNKLQVASCKQVGTGTQVVLHTSWKTPFNFRINGQSYKSKDNAYSGRAYEVTTSSATQVDIVFSNTVQALGDVNIQGNPTFSKAEWLGDTQKKTVTLRLTLRTPGRFYGCSASYNAEGSLVLNLKKKPSSSLSGYRILINAGHGGKDSGAVCAISSNASFRYEKQINLALAKKIKAKLEAKGATVIMNRTDDGYDSIEEIRDFTRAQKPDLFLAVHCDASPSGSARGTSAFYYNAYSYPLANEIHRELVDVYKNDIYKGRAADIMNRIDRHSAAYPFLVTRTFECPAILVEFGFVTNLDECRNLQTPAVQDKLAAAAVRGFEAYVAKN